MSKITYTNKVALNENPSVADINKVKATDLNEIKQVVNANDDELIELKSTTLYTSPSGTTGAITLSESCANYNYIEVYYQWSDGNLKSSSKVSSPNGKTCSLYEIFYSGAYSSLRIATDLLTFNGTSITRSNQYAQNIGTASATSGQFIYVYKILGYK